LTELGVSKHGDEAKMRWASRGRNMRVGLRKGESIVRAVIEKNVGELVLCALRKSWEVGKLNV